MALARWLLEYWTQPSDFSWEDFLPMMQVSLILLYIQSTTPHPITPIPPTNTQHVLLTLRDEMVDTVHPAIHKLQRRLEDMSIDPAAVPMVKAARARLQKIAPAKPFTAYLIYYRSTRHLAAFLLSMLFSWLLPRLGLLPQYPHPAATGGLIVPWALLPLVLQDLLVLNHYLPQLLLLAQADYTDADGASLLLQGTSLATVWENLRYAVRALEGGLHVVRVYQPSDRALGFINAMTLAYARAREQAAARGGEAAVALLGADGWMFAGGWAAMELLRIKASPHGSRIAGAAGDASVIYRSLMAVYGDWLVHAPGIFNTVRSVGWFVVCHPSLYFQTHPPRTSTPLSPQPPVAPLPHVHHHARRHPCAPTAPPPLRPQRQRQRRRRRWRRRLPPPVPRPQQRAEGFFPFGGAGRLRLDAPRRLVPLLRWFLPGRERGRRDPRRPHQRGLQRGQLLVPRLGGRGPAGPRRERRPGDPHPRPDHAGDVVCRGAVVGAGGGGVLQRGGAWVRVTTWRGLALLWSINPSIRQFSPHTYSSCPH